MATVLERPAKQRQREPAAVTATPVKSAELRCCATCRHFARFRRRGEHASNDVAAGQGHCRRYPPSVHTSIETAHVVNAADKPVVRLVPTGWRSDDPSSGQSVITLLPVVSADFVCGEYQVCQTPGVSADPPR